MTKSRVAYESSTGDIVELNKNGFHCDDSALRAFTWDYNFSARPDGSGGTVSLFSRNEKTKQFDLSAHFSTEAELADALNILHNTTEQDVRTRTPGKLWLDEQYISCYIVASEVVNRSKRTHFAVKRLTVLPVIPYWCSEETKNFAIGGSTTSSPDAKRYNGRYPYKYGTGYAQTMLDNAVGNWETPMLIVIYGPAVDHSLSIGGSIYALNVSIAKNERIVVDQLHKKIYKVGTTGIKTNLYNERDKTHDIFKPAPVGMVPVLYSGSYAFDVTLVHQRSEPLWT